MGFRIYSLPLNYQNLIHIELYVKPGFLYIRSIKAGLSAQNSRNRIGGTPYNEIWQNQIKLIHTEQRWIVIGKGGMG